MLSLPVLNCRKQHQNLGKTRVYIEIAVNKSNIHWQVVIKGNQMYYVQNHLDMDFIECTLNALIYFSLLFYILTQFQQMVSRGAMNKDHGLVFRSFIYLFEQLEARKNDATFVIKASYLEIYNEKVRLSSPYCIKKIIFFF